MRYQFGVLNIAGAALLGVGFQQGLIQTVWEGDQTHLSAVIFAIFLAGLISAAFNRHGFARFVERRLVLLGLIGTVIGFVIALAGVDPATAGDIDQITGMVAGLISGLGTAMYTTLVGAVGSLWLAAARFVQSNG
jgi:hypothetical protein